MGLRRILSGKPERHYVLSTPRDNVVMVVVTVTEEAMVPVMLVVGKGSQ